jgi:hypothetical protein
MIALPFSGGRQIITSFSILCPRLTLFGGTALALCRGSRGSVLANEYENSEFIDIGSRNKPDESRLVFVPLWNRRGGSNKRCYERTRPYGPVLYAANI